MSDRYRLIVGGHAVAVIPPEARDVVRKLAEQMAAAFKRPVTITFASVPIACAPMRPPPPVLGEVLHITWARGRPSRLTTKPDGLKNEPLTSDDEKWLAEWGRRQRSWGI